MTQFAGPLFIVGMPRSGTKLLRELLNRHPRIGIADVESEFLPWLERRFARFGELRERANFDAFYARMLRLSYFRLRREQGRLVDAARWHAACAEFTAAGVFEALMRLEVDAPRGGARIWGDKSPSYIDDLPLIRKLYPAAKVLHIIRDVRDYCLSMHHAWGKDMPRAAQRWVDGVTRARADGAAFGADYLELRYEDLLAGTEAELRRICAFLGVEFQPCMLALASPAERRGAGRGTTRVLAHNHGKFARAMAPQTLARIEDIAGHALHELRYAPSAPPRPPRRLSALELRMAQLRDAWHLARAGEAGWGFWRTALFHLRYFVTTRG